MATRTAKGKGPLDSLTEIHDLGNGMKLYRAGLTKLREQNVNARMMGTAEHAQLVNNIKKRGLLESVPYCVIVDDVVEIVSGHHRIRAAREAGLKDCIVLVDESKLTRSQVTSKQLAHNRLVGFDDADTLAALYESLLTIDERLESGLASDMEHADTLELDRALAPTMDMDWKIVTFIFLPHQLSNLEALIDAIPPSDALPVGNVEQFDAFAKAVVKYARLKNAVNAGMVIAEITERMLTEIKVIEDKKAEPDG